jgi:hypothetical protein
MKFSTENLITAVLKADDEQKNKIFNILTGADSDKQTSQQEKMLTKKEASAFLGISPASLDRFVQNKKVTKIQFGGKHSKNLFKLSELQALIETSKTILNPTAQEATV